MIGDTWDPTVLTRSLRYLSEDCPNHKSIIHQLDLIGVFIQFNVKYRVLLNLAVYMENTS